MSTVVFEVEFSCQSTDTLQNAFIHYRQKKQKEVLRKRRMEELSKIRGTQPHAMISLRRKFFERAMAYIGVPYAKRYHSPDSPTHHSDKFLDCCGLVRQVLRDLKADFGFTVGPWNQAYMFDTLPIELPSPQEMQQGDLVFVSGSYFDKNMSELQSLLSLPVTEKPQRHNIVHVEIWAGDQEKTLGARWQKGAVQMHDSYKFVSKSYGDMKYYFRSIDTWLIGICRSYCAEHPWSVSKYDPQKHSVFALKDEPAWLPEDDEQASISDGESAIASQCGLTYTSDRDSESVCSSDEYIYTSDSESGCVSDSEWVCSPKEQGIIDINHSKWIPTCLSNIKPDDWESASDLQLQTTSDDELHHSSCAGTELPGVIQLPTNSSSKKPPASSSVPQHGRAAVPAASGQVPSGASKDIQIRKSPHIQWPKSIPLSKCNGPIRRRTFVLCGKNAAPIVDSYLTSKGWRKLDDSKSSSFALKWVECKGDINYHSFKEGLQMVNHFPNINLLTTKIGLLDSIRRYDQKMSSLESSTPLNMHEFVPLTYRLDVTSEKEEFLRHFAAGDIWICKPSGFNQGKGIFLVRDPQVILEEKHTSPQARIIQKYIMSPLLIDQRKFDIRVYMLIIAGTPFFVFYHTGYIRLSCLPYNPSGTEMCIHLTNQYQQKKHPSYHQVKEETVWSFEKLQSYVTQHYHLPEDWVANTLTKRMQQIMQICFQSVADQLTCKTGFFDLLGFDFMVDSSFNVWLIEVNINPAMHTNCDTLRSMIPTIVQETLDLAIEVFDKQCNSQAILPLTSLQTFVPL